VLSGLCECCCGLLSVVVLSLLRMSIFYAAVANK